MAFADFLPPLSKYLKSEQISQKEEDRKYYGRDWTTYFDINCTCVVFPYSTEELSCIVKLARQYKVALIPSGGRTGLSGGAVATQGEVIVSFEKMNKVLEFDTINRTVKTQAGVVTEEIQNFAHSKNLFYPVDFAAKGSSHIGGNVATNAGGIKVLRYGLTREWILGLTVVTGEGEILQLGGPLIKNATGLDLRHLFIGSEGILGFITEVLIRLTTPPPALKVLLLATPDLDSIMKVFHVFQNSVTLTAFEMLSDIAMQKVLQIQKLNAPLDSAQPSLPEDQRSRFYVVCEVECGDESAENKILETFEKAVESGIVTDGTMSQSEAQNQEFWKYRERISESISGFSPYKNDISVPISQVPYFMTELDAQVSAGYPGFTLVWFGHIGDGNLHLNILRPDGMSKEDFVKKCQAMDPMVFATVQKHGGSISAEHGVGLTKKPFLKFTKSAAEIELMKKIKKVFDPDNIINPGKVIDL